MSSSPIVSIVSIAYNQERYIRETLEGFVKQETNFDIEVVIADDGSSDKTQQIIKEYQKKYPGIFQPILRKKNIGAWQNMADAMKSARGDYIAICEGDDYWTDPKKLQLQVDYLDKHPNYAICFHPVKIIVDEDKTQNRIFPIFRKDFDFNLLNLMKENYIQTNSVMYRRQDYSDLPKEVLPGDWYLHLYHARFGKIGYINRIMATYRRHSGSLWWAKDEKSHWRKNAIVELDMHKKALDLFSQDEIYNDAIYQPIVYIFRAIASFSNNKTLLEAINAFPELAANSFMRVLAFDKQHESNLESLLNQSNEHIKKLDQILRENNARIRKLEQDIQNSIGKKIWLKVKSLKYLKSKLGTKYNEK